MPKIKYKFVGIEAHCDVIRIFALKSAALIGSIGRWLHVSPFSYETGAGPVIHEVKVRMNSQQDPFLQPFSKSGAKSIPLR